MAYFKHTLKEPDEVQGYFTGTVTYISYIKKAGKIKDSQSGIIYNFYTDEIIGRWVYVDNIVQFSLQGKNAVKIIKISNK